MSRFKRTLVTVCAAALVAVMCVCLIGCGKPTAATWSKGSIEEEKVTNTITSMRSGYGLTSNDSGWAQFVKERTYKDDGTSQTSAVDQAAQGNNADTEKKADGTVEEMRSYVIEQLIRAEIINNEIKSRNITVTDQEVAEFVEQMREYIESQTMKGVFESYLQQQGYKDLNAYKEEVREELKQSKLQEEISSFTKDDGTQLTGEEAFNAWLDKAYQDANVTINKMPDSIPYAIVETTNN